MSKWKTIQEQIDHKQVIYYLASARRHQFRPDEFTFRSCVRIDDTDRTLRFIYIVNTCAPRVPNNHAYAKRVYSSRGHRASAP